MILAPQYPVFTSSSQRVWNAIVCGQGPFALIVSHLVLHAEAVVLALLIVFANMIGRVVTTQKKNECITTYCVAMLAFFAILFPGIVRARCQRLETMWKEQEETPSVGRIDDISDATSGGSLEPDDPNYNLLEIVHRKTPSPPRGDLSSLIRPGEAAGPPVGRAFTPVVEQEGSEGHGSSFECIEEFPSSEVIEPMKTHLRQATQHQIGWVPSALKGGVDPNAMLRDWEDVEDPECFEPVPLFSQEDIDASFLQQGEGPVLAGDFEPSPGALNQMRYRLRKFFGVTPPPLTAEQRAWEERVHQLHRQFQEMEVRSPSNGKPQSNSTSEESWEKV